MKKLEKYKIEDISSALKDFQCSRGKINTKKWLCDNEQDLSPRLTGVYRDRRDPTCSHTWELVKTTNKEETRDKENKRTQVGLGISFLENNNKYTILSKTPPLNWHAWRKGVEVAIRMMLGGC